MWPKIGAGQIEGNNGDAIGQFAMPDDRFYQLDPFEVIPSSTNLSALLVYPFVAEKLLHGLGVVGPAVDGLGDRRLDVIKL